MQNRIRDVLDAKGRQVFTIGPGSSVREAVATMALRNVGALVVVEYGRPIGLVSERDALWRVVHENRPAETRVRDVMNGNPLVIREEIRVTEAMRIMTERRVRHLPVLDRAELVGLVSIGDLTNWVTRDLELHVEALVSYIHGPYAHEEARS